MTRRNTIGLKKRHSSDELSAKLARVYDTLDIFEANRERGGKVSWGYVINELKYSLGERINGNTEERRR